MTEKPTEFGLGKTDFCRNCQYYAPYRIQEPVASGTCRVNPPTHQGFPDAYADQWCKWHALTPEEQMKRLEEISELNKSNRMPGQIFNPNDPSTLVRADGEPITIIPPVNAGKSQQMRYNTLSDGVNSWEHYPEVDGL